ncbi:MAG: IS91 family transposase [Lachnospiraceae bacterium]|nr:IS91 family transposase [Lachnospiraceae bacterium]
MWSDNTSPEDFSDLSVEDQLFFAADFRGDSTPSKIRDIFQIAGPDILADRSLSLSDEQRRVIDDIAGCRSEFCGFNVEKCTACGRLIIHYNSCGNRSCPICGKLRKELWVDKRSSEVLDCAYYHAVFTCPHELNPFFLGNKKILYSMFHRCVGHAVTELAQDPEYLGAVPGIIQVLHTWNQELLYHPHIHAVISGCGLTDDRKLVSLHADDFFIPESVLAAKFRGKFLAELQEAWASDKLSLNGELEKYRNSYEWNEFRDSLYNKKWVAYVKETFNGKGNAIEYLGRYTYQIAISESRILSVSKDEVRFSARGKDGHQSRVVSVTPREFVLRFLLHVLPKGFQKIRYFGYLNNRYRKNNLIVLFNLQGFRKYKEKYEGLSKAEVIQIKWGHDVKACPLCHAHALVNVTRTRGKP